MIAIMIMIVPVAIGVPAPAVLIPPAMVFVPAAFAGFTQFMTCMLRLPAVPPVILDGFMEPVVRFGNTPLALVIAFG
jgi:hypothetical protein